MKTTNLTTAQPIQRVLKSTIKLFLPILTMRATKIRSLAIKLFLDVLPALLHALQHSLLMLLILIPLTTSFYSFTLLFIVDPTPRTPI